jgi:hypothetical protein
MFKILKSVVFAVSFLARYVSWTNSRTARDFSHPTVKTSHQAVNLMQMMQNKYKNLWFSPRGNWLMINCLYSVGGFTAHREIFTVWWDKSLAVQELVDTYRARNEAANTIIFN